MPVDSQLLGERDISISIELDPVLTVLNSLLLIIKADERTDLSPWVYKARSLLSAERYHANRLVLLGCHYALLPEGKYENFSLYLEDLKNEDPLEIRERLLKVYRDIPPHTGESASESTSSMLESGEAYLEYLRARFCENNIDEELEREAFLLVKNPAVLKETIIEHLTYMWDTHLRAECEDRRPLLEDTVGAFRTAELSGMDPVPVLEYITGQKLAANTWNTILEKVDEIHCIPSAHTGRFISKLKKGTCLYVFFNARVPGNLQNPELHLNRAELATRLAALGDPTRLHILTLISERGRLSSKEVIFLLDLSQSAASRHLKQLTAVGFLNEARFENGKTYSINREKFSETLDLISRSFLTN